MRHIKFQPVTLFLTCVCFTATSEQRAPVSWVNPQLPEGPGLTHHILKSKVMGHEVGYVVWVPEDFDRSGRTRYPVIYFLHGMGGNESADAGGFSSQVARGMREGHMPPVICVFPNGGRSGYRGTVEKMIVEELIPLVDRTYPTRPEAKHRAIAGFSMGGAGAVQLSIKHPELFCVAGSWGGGMWREADALLSAVDQSADTLKEHEYGVLLVNGDQDRPDAFKLLAEKLSQMNIEHEVVVLKDTPHNLGLYYQRAGETMTEFLGRRLKRRRLETGLTRSVSGQKEEILRALKKAATYYRDHVASHGGYVYYYSPDLQQRWGEGKASVDTIFVQPPGTPTVGMAYLKAYTVTGDHFYLEAAREAAEALVQGQLVSGGWTQVIHFARPERGRMGNYRKGPRGSWNNSSLDDGQTQSALQFLCHADQAINFQHAEIHEAVLFGLNALLKAQFPNGAFPQVWKEPVESKPVLKARFPDYDWKTEGRVKNYWDYYTLNDCVAGTVAQTLIVAHQVYRDEKYKNALRKLGDFLLLAQMPEPQPGWCQQYNYEMVPIWARKFEPPAITGWESQDAMETLIKIARFTGDSEYLDPIPAALDYFTEKCLLPDGKIARYYEFRSNKPLYMDSNYRLTYAESAAPRHYGWKQDAKFDAIEKLYQAAKNGQNSTRIRSLRQLEKDAYRMLRELDNEGRWITTYEGERLVGQPPFRPGFRYLSSKVFSRNIETLSEYLGSLSRNP